MKKIIFILALLAYVPHVSAQCGPSTPAYTSSGNTLTAATPGESDVQNTLNAVTSSITVVSIPSGSCGWTGQVTFTVPSGNTSLTIQGNTTITCSGTAGGSSYSCTATDNSVILDDYNSGNPLWQITTGSVSSFFRVTGLTIKGGTANQSKNNDGLIQMLGSSQNVRFDHNDLDVSTYTVGGSEAAIMRTTGAVAGVMDHNVFKNIYGSFENGIQVDGSVTTSPANGDGEWAQPTPLGSALEFYLEANYFNGGYANDCSEGGAIVERYNMFVNISNALQTHSTKTPAGSGRGCRFSEFYHNYIASCSSVCDAAGGSKEGSQLVWGNTLAAGQNWNEFWSSCTDRNGCEGPETNTPNGWGYCGTATINYGGSGANGVGSTWDGNTTSYGYPCLDGLGRGQTVQVLNGGVFPNRLNSSTGTIAWPQQYLEPFYLWMNTLNGKTELKIEDNVSQANRDYYIDNPSFNGTTGTGFGLLSARPATCTAGPGGTYGTSPTGSYGVAYWATDANGGNGELYVCTATNTWTGIYEPLIFPHPLDTNSTVTLSPSSENFGSVNIGSSSSPVTFTLSDSSGVTATSINPTVSGGNTADFSIINTGVGSCGAAGGSLTNGISCTFTVTFTPQAVGSRSATASVAYGGGDGLSPQTEALSGTGASSGSVSLTPSSNNFGSVIVGIAGSPTTFTLSNTTGVTVTGITVTFIGANGSDFSRSGGTCGTTLAIGSSCTIFVEFTPGATGARAGTLNVADSDSSSPQQSSLSGTGINGTVTISPSSQNFGSVVVGALSSPVTFTLTNTNATAVTGIAVSFVGGNNSDFFPSGGTCGSSLPGNSSCTIILVFQPSAVGARATALNVADSASSSPQQSSLSGTGVAGAFTSGPSAFPM